MVQTFYVERTDLVKLLGEDEKLLCICKESEWRQKIKEYEIKEGTIILPLYKYPDKEELYTWDELPEGATRIDPGNFMYAKCPGGHTWCIDGRASNCTKPEDKEHKCWIRHGDPKLCNVTVDKNGNTCSAGAGSIQTHNWHGFLRDGKFVE